MLNISWYVEKASIIKQAEDVIKRGEIVKHNKKRTVYRGNGLYIKHDHPDCLVDKLKAIFFPKSKREFNSALLLKDLSIPVVPVLGWGKQRTNNYLITKEIKGSVLLKDIFLNISNKDLNMLLTSLALFLNKLLTKKIYHPDLHSGNILVKKVKEEYNFYLLDLYGIKTKKRLSDNDKFRLFAWLVTILLYVEEEKIKEFLINSGFCKEDEFPEKWIKLLIWRARYLKSRCRKRKEKLFKNSSLCKAFTVENGILLIKDGIEVKAKKAYKIKRLSAQQAKRCWINSYFLPLFGISVYSHFLYLRKEGKAVIFTEIPEGAKLSEAVVDHRIKEIIKRLNYWCKIAGIDAKLELSNLYIREGSLFCLCFSNPEDFYLI